MGLDHEIGATRTMAAGARRGTHLPPAMLVLGMLMIMGPLAPASAETPSVGTRQVEENAARSAGNADALPFADRTIHTGGIPVADNRALITLSRAASADRHIEIGSLLLIVSLMAATTFSLWRWQLRGLIADANHRDA